MKKLSSSSEILIFTRPNLPDINCEAKRGKLFVVVEQRELRESVSDLSPQRK